jgi:predicted DsbA family dithiol-disulfide isomerase
MTEHRVEIDYFSDLLCIWAYVGHVRMAELRRTFEKRIEIAERWVPVFGNTARKIGEGWADRGGFAGYARHVREIATGFDHVELHPDVWTKNAPAGSLAAHTFVKAASLVCDDGSSGDPAPSEELAWRLRLAFFRDARNIAALAVQTEVARELGLPTGAISQRLEDGSAFAALAADHERAAKNDVGGSPTWIMNDGRQKLYGNVGYRVVEANVEELLRDNADKASWC